MIDAVTDLMPGAEKCVNKCAKVDEEDHVLIIIDNPRIARALSRALKARRPQGTGAVECFYIGGHEDGLRPNQDLPSGLEHALQQATIVFNAFNAYDRDWSFVQRILDSPKQCPKQKVFHFVGLHERMFYGQGALGLTDDEFDRMKEDTENLAVALTIASEVKIEAFNGLTDLQLSLGDPENVALQSTGQIREGTWGNLPSGEAFVLPTSATGTIVIDKAVGGFETAFQAFTLHIDQGRVRVTGKPGPAGAKLERVLKKHERIAREKGWPEDNVRQVCEFGIGTNPKAHHSFYPENEKILGTIHIAVGSNDIFGGPIKAPTHIDLIVERPTVKLDNRSEILVDGELNRSAIEDFPKINHENVEVDGVSPTQVVRRFRERAVPTGGYLRRKWIDTRSNLLEAYIGNHHTAEQACQLWESFDDDRNAQPVQMLVESFRQQIRSDKNQTHTVLRLLRVMEQFGAVELG